jgi:hypothetical protein
MVDFVTDKRFIVGALVGAFVVPYVLKTVSLRMSARTAVVSA